MPTLEEYRKFKEAYKENGMQGFIDNAVKTKKETEQNISSPSIKLPTSFKNMSLIPNLDNVKPQLTTAEDNNLQAKKDTWTDTTRNLEGIAKGVGAFVNKFSDSATLGLLPTLQKAQYNTQLQNPIRTTAPINTLQMKNDLYQQYPKSATSGELAGYLIPGAGIAKGLKATTLGAKLLPSVGDSFLQGVGKAMGTGALEFGTMGAIEGGLESVRENKPFLPTVAQKAGEGVALGGAFSGIGKAAGKYALPLIGASLGGTINASDTYNKTNGDIGETLKSLGIGALTGFGAGYGLNKLGKYFKPNEINAPSEINTPLDTNIPTQERLALPPYKGEVIEGYPSGYPLNKPMEPLALPNGERLALPPAKLALAPKMPVKLGESPQGRFTIKPEELIVASNAKPKAIKRKVGIFDEVVPDVPVRTVKTIEVPRPISDFKPKNSTKESIDNYYNQINSYNPVEVQPPNFKTETPFKVFPAELAQARKPLNVPNEFKTEIFNTNNVNKSIKPPKVRNNMPKNEIIQPQTILSNKQAKTNLTESPINAIKTEGNINSPLSNKNAIQSNVTQFKTNAPKTSDIPMDLRGESQIKTNTMRKLPELDSVEGNNFYKNFEATYEKKPDKISIDRANQMLQNDYEGTYNRLTNEGINSKEDNLAGFQISRDLLKAKRWDEANAFMSKIRPSGTNAAQIVQSFNTVAKDSLEGVALRAKKLIQSAEEEFLTNNPEINKAIKSVDNILKQNIKMIPFDLQMFSQKIDKELKQTMGKLYKKEYVDSILKLIKETPEFTPANIEKISNAIKQKFGLPTFDGNDLEKISELIDKMEGLNPRKWQYRAYKDEIDKVVRGKLPKTVADKLSTYQFINMYGNSLTPIKIGGGNIASMGADHAKDWLKYVFEKVLTGGKSKIVLPSLKTKAKGIIKSVKEIELDRKHEVDTDPFLQSYDIDMKRGLTYQNKYVRPVEKYVKYFMTIMERPAKQAIYDDKLRMLMKKANVSEGTEEMFNEAIEQANTMAFANQTKASNIVNTARRGLNYGSSLLFNKSVNSGIGQKLNLQKYSIPEKNMGDFGIGSLTQPIIKTPLNMLKMAGDYMGAGVLFARNKSELADALAKAVVGGVFGVGAGYYGKKTGYISGGLPTDKDARNFGEESGRQPYSLNLLGKSISLDNVQPFGMLNSFGAELASDNPQKAPFTAALDSLLNNAMLQGFAKMLGSTGLQRGSLSENIVDAVTGGASTMVPLGSLQNQISKTIDPYKRDTADDSILYKNLINKTMARTPLRLTLPPKVSTTGEKAKEDNFLNTWLLPNKVKEIKNDAVTNELNRLYEQSNETKQFPPNVSSTISYKTTKKGEPQKIELTSEQKADFQSLLGQENMRAIEKVIQTSNYKKANDKEKADIISNEMSKSKQYVENKFLKSIGIKEYQALKNLSRNRLKR